MQAENYAEKESWIGALGKAMIKKSVMIDDDMEDRYMWCDLCEVIKWMISKWVSDKKECLSHLDWSL